MTVNNKTLALKKTISNSNKINELFSRSGPKMNGVNSVRLALEKIRIVDILSFILMYCSAKANIAGNTAEKPNPITTFPNQISLSDV